MPGDAAAGSGRSAIRSSRGRLAEPARLAVTAVDEASLAEALSAAAGAGFYLTCVPFRGRMWCDVDPDKVSALQSNDRPAR